MAQKHFRRGYPRNGQWVLVDGSRLAIVAHETARARRAQSVVPPEDASDEIKGRIAELGEYLDLARRVGDKAGAKKITKQLVEQLGAKVNEGNLIVVDAPKLVREYEVPNGKTKVRVEFVDANGDYDLAAPGGGVGMIELDRLVPVLDRSRIPEKRLAASDPNWQPAP